MGFKVRDQHMGGPYNWDRNILGSILGSPFFLKFTS